MPAPRRTKAAVLQLNSGPDLESNLAAAARLTREAAADGATLIVLPECFALLGPEDAKLGVAETLPEGGPVLARCAALSRETGAELVLGGFWERGRDATHVRNSCVHLGADGAVRAIYRKITCSTSTCPTARGSRRARASSPATRSS